MSKKREKKSSKNKTFPPAHSSLSIFPFKNVISVDILFCYAPSPFSARKMNTLWVGGFLFDIFIARSMNSCDHFDALSATLVDNVLDRKVALH